MPSDGHTASANGSAAVTNGHVNGPAAATGVADRPRVYVPAEIARKWSRVVSLHVIDLCTSAPIAALPIHLQDQGILHDYYGQLWLDAKIPHCLLSKADALQALQFRQPHFHSPEKAERYQAFLRMCSTGDPTYQAAILTALAEFSKEAFEFQCLGMVAKEEMERDQEGQADMDLSS